MFRLFSLRNVAGIATLVLLGCGDATGPATATLISVSPAPAADRVDRSTTITLAFGQAMMAGMEQYVDLHLGGITGPTVPMACNWSADRTRLTCAPNTPLTAGTQYSIHVGAGMKDGQGHMMDLDDWTSMGGHWATSGMMGGSHAGQPAGMMDAGWRHGGHYGMVFSFTTA